MSFKVGDKVRQVNPYTYGFVGDSILTVYNYDFGVPYPVYCTMNQDTWVFTDEELELVQ